MNWLLKIVEGPMKGAEIALVGGMRLKVGRDEQCDIVLADATLADVAFELDVADEAVTVIAPDGAARALPPFEIRSFGTTAIAVGPADGEWRELVRPPAEEPAAETPAPEEAPKDGEAGEPAAEEPAEDAAEKPKPADEAEPEKRKSHGCAFGCLLMLILLLLAVAALWWFWPQVGGRVTEWYEAGRDKSVEIWTSWTKPSEKEGPAEAVETRTPPAAGQPTLEDLVKAHGLVLSETNGLPFVSGNLKKRTERLAIRALALSRDRRTLFDLTDDETLRDSVEALLFTLTEGALKVLVATNRVVEIGGYAKGVGDLDRVARALAADVPGLRTLAPVRNVKVGGTAPRQPVRTASVRESAAGPAKPAETAKTSVAATVGLVADGAAPRDFPVAGILTVPYPCVVLRDGMRCVEGAQVGGLTLEKIEANRLTFRGGTETIVWEP